MSVLRHGIDLVEVRRIASMLEEHGSRFIQRCFTEREREYAESGPRRRAERYAVRFACKEAVMKALGTGWRSGIRWRDIEVTHDSMGRPRLTLSGRCEELARELAIVSWEVSLSHTDAYAVASVLGSGMLGTGEARRERRA
ncbi:MAG: holo-ACP synthase [Phycisphaerales bacterium]|nr:MAG: holo-ACP synthase [Phycisphaerales bacterium]